MIISHAQIFLFIDPSRKCSIDDSGNHLLTAANKSRSKSKKLRFSAHGRRIQL
jgi:hypothetical protein